MRFRYRLLDPSLAPYLFVCKRRVVALYDAGVRIYDRWWFTTLFTAQMRIQGDDVYVLVKGAVQGYFEFQSSGFPVVPNGTFATATILKPVVVGVDLKVDGGAMQADATIFGGGHAETAFSVSPIARPEQIQILDEPVQYPGPISGFGGYPDALYESYAPGTSHTGVYLRAYVNNYLPYFSVVSGVSAPAMELRDVSYDVVYQTGKAKNKVLQAFVTDDTFDWPRSTGRRTVESETYGKREFGIIIDAFDQVIVFPTSRITAEHSLGFGAPGQNVDDLYIQYARIPLPTWVYAKTQTFKSYYADVGNAAHAAGLKDFPEIDWKLHPDGTACAAVVHERVQAQFNAAFFNTYATDTGTQGPNKYWPDTSTFDTLVRDGFGAGMFDQTRIQDAAGENWYHVGVGLIEVDIDITLTGPGDGEFTIALTVHERRRPTTSPYCPLVAGYCWHGVSKVADRGDLMSLDVECYGSTDSGNTGSLFSLKNITQGEKEVLSMHAASTNVNNPLDISRPPTGEPQLLAYNMSTLSFLVKMRTVEITDFGLDRFSDPKETYCGHFGVAVWVMGKLKEVLTPSTMDPTMKLIVTQQAKANRAVLLSTYSDLVLLPQNDLRDWTDSDMLNLREDYARDASPIGTYVAGFWPYNNFSEMQTKGNLYYKNTRDYSVPSAAARSYYEVMAQGGFRPFGWFYVTEPRPGWHMYARAVIDRLGVNARCTFFTHPNGTYALFDQNHLYNANPQFFPPYIDPALDQYAGSTVADLNINRIEPCVFDKVHFELPLGINSTGTAKRDTSFLDLYNSAYEKALRLGTLTDDSIQSAQYADFTPALSITTFADSVTPSLVYAQLQLDWYDGYRAFRYDTSYWDGVKSFTLTAGFDGTDGGSLIFPTLADFWFDSTHTFLEYPTLFNGAQTTFSSCVLITK